MHSDALRLVGDWYLSQEGMSPVFEFPGSKLAHAAGLASGKGFFQTMSADFEQG
jgi:hypothetical protein